MSFTYAFFKPNSFLIIIFGIINIKSNELVNFAEKILNETES
jgi:hypothetical protein